MKHQIDITKLLVRLRSYTGNSGHNTAHRDAANAIELLLHSGAKPRPTDAQIDALWRTEELKPAQLIARRDIVRQALERL